MKPHGKRGTSIYRIWTNMVSRCTNPRIPAWEHYGGRGIKVCDRWRTFANFLEDMGDRPDDKTLERIDNEGDYEPTNCRWATMKEQCSNRRPRRDVGELSGRSKLTEEAVREIRQRRDAGETLLALATRFGVAISLISRVDRRESWRHVK